MIRRRKLTKAIETIGKEESLVIATNDTGDGNIECYSVLTKNNDKVGQALYATLLNSNEIRTFILGVVSKYLSRYEVEQKAFIESLK